MVEFLKKRKNIMILLSLFTISLIFIMPSIIYLLQNKTLDGFNTYFSWSLKKLESKQTRIADALCFEIIFFLISFIYIKVIKREKDIFKNFKQILLVILIQGIIFLIAVPYATSDIFYYLGTGWLESKYDQNPYYVAVSDFREHNTDEVLRNTGYWENTTCVYGPGWSFISKTLAGMSMGNVTIGIYVYKIVAVLIHLAICILIYKITNSRKYVLIYGLNPTLLFHMITNVHNDEYLVLFVLLAIYFLLKKKNIFMSIAMLALSTSIKYLTIILLPFFLLYYFQDKKILQKILYSIGYSIIFIAIIFLTYLLYIEDFSVFTAMLVQGERYSQSIWSLLLVLNNLKICNIDISFLRSVIIVIFIFIYINLCIKYLFLRKINFQEIMKDYSLMVILFIFGVLTNFQIWYLIWLIPGLLFIKRNLRDFSLMLLNVSSITLAIYFYIQCDAYMYGITQSLTILVIATLIKIIRKRRKIC